MLKVPKCGIFDLMDSRDCYNIQPQWAGNFGTVIKNSKLFRFRHGFNVFFFRENLELVHAEPALKKLVES